jgi:MFS family permease
METATTPATKAGLLINRNFAWLWTGQAISLLGDLIYDTALVFWIVTDLARGQSWAPLAVSGVLVAQSIPRLIVRPLAGVFVDRWDKRRTMLWMDAIRAVLVALLVLATGSISLPFFSSGRLSIAWQLGTLYSVVLLATICAQFFYPARLALTGDVVQEARRGRAFGLDYVSENITVVVGPPLAALLFFGAGVQWTLLLNALSFVGSFLCVLLVRPPQAARSVAPGERGHLLRELGAGFRFFAQSRLLLTITVTNCIIMLGAGALNTLNIFFALENLHLSANLYGFLLTSLGVGAIAGAAIAALLIDRLGAARAYWLSIVVVGMLILLYARTTSFVPALIILFLLGLPLAAANVAEGPLILNATPREFVGRVNSIILPAITLTALFSTALTGFLASTALAGLQITLLSLRFGPIDTIFTGTGILCILAGLYAMLNLPATKPADEAPAHPL